jgi:hypothetical protein
MASTTLPKEAFVSRHVMFSETEFPACIPTNKIRSDGTQRQCDYSDSGIFLDTGTHSNSGDDREANFLFQGDKEASADGEEE